MRARLLLSALLAVPVAFAYACSGSGDVIDDGGTPDVQSGNETGTTKPDGSTPKDGSTPNDSGSSDSASFNDSSSSNDSGAKDVATSDGPLIDLGCQKPSDCTNQFCCGTIVFNGGNFPNCDLKSLTSACQSTCKSTINLSCNTTDTLRACAQNSDCSDAGNLYKQCCNVPFADASANVCWDGTLAGAVGGKCQ